MEFYITSYTNISTVGFVSVDIFRTGEGDMNFVLSCKSDG